MEYSYLTPHKIELINRFIGQKPEEYLVHTDLPNNLPHYDTNIKIYSFKYENGDELSSLKMIYEFNDMIYYIRLCNTNICNSFNNIKTKFSSYFNTLTVEDEDEYFNYSYCRGVLIEDYDLNLILMKPLIQRVIPDYELGSFDETELYRFTGKSIEEIITFDEFDILIDTNYKIRHFNGGYYTPEKLLLIKKYLYQPYYRSKIGKYMDINDAPVFVTIIKDDKYVFVKYSIDYIGAKWILYTIVKIRDSWDDLWNKLTDHEKGLIIKSHIN